MGRFALHRHWSGTFIFSWSGVRRLRGIDFVGQESALLMAKMVVNLCLILLVMSIVVPLFAVMLELIQ